MATAWSASATWGQPASASEWTAMARMPSARQARITRRAISPRLATRTLASTRSGGADGLDAGHVEGVDAPALRAPRPARGQGRRKRGSVEAELHEELLADARDRD